LLSAGKSVRNGRDEGTSSSTCKLVIERLIEEYLSSKIDELIVVVGYNGEKLESIIKSLFISDKLRVVYNENYESGMYSSVVKGSKEAIFPNTLLGLVDQPLITKEIINKIIDAYDFKHIVVPSYSMKGGHPVVFPEFVKKEILLKPYSTLKDVFESFRERIVYVETSEEVVVDMDTKEDYEAILKYFLGDNV